jgi:hypothetical protein
LEDEKKKRALVFMMSQRPFRFSRLVRADGGYGLLGNENGVDDVDYAVGALNVGFGDGGVIDHDFAAVGVNGNGLAVHGFGFGHFRDLCGGNAAGNDVIGEDGDELFFVFGLEQIVDGAGWELSEGSVGGRENGERASTFQSVGKAGGLNRGGEGFELAGGYGGVDDVFFGGRGCGRDLGYSESDGGDDGYGE